MRKYLSLKRPFEKGLAAHFYLLQFVVFFYLIYRLASRSYIQYGYLNPSYSRFPRYINDNLFYPVSKIFTGHFIYDWVPYPSPTLFTIMTALVIFTGVFGLLGIRPKLCAAFSGITYLHILGFMQATNSEIDGGTLLLGGLFVLTISPTKCFYSFKKFEPKVMTADFNWPIFLFMLICSFYYVSSGINKIFDVGPHWPWVLNLDALAQTCIQKSVFLSSRYSNSFVCSLANDTTHSIMGGLMTLVGEIVFFLCLFNPFLGLIVAVLMIGLHTSVFLTAGINFTGNSFLILLCVDLSRLYKVSYEFKSSRKINQIP